MSLFGALVRTAVNVATLPVSVAKDSVMFLADAGDGKFPGKRTAENLRKLKDEADA